MIKKNIKRYRMETLRKDELFKIALEFDLPDLLRFCTSSKKINEKICQRNDIWLIKLKEFPNNHKLKLSPKLSPKETYILL